MKVAIIGGGIAGLSAIKKCLDESIECVAFEQTGEIGGTWNYHDEILDENGKPLHTAMYQGLCSNLPKELMEFDDFHYKNIKDSFITQQEVLQYVQQYAEHFNLLSYIKLFHQVELVDPLPNNQWTVTVKNLKSNEIQSQTFDGVIVCNGHFFQPFIPTIKGMESFKGNSIHSHFYRKPDKYKGKRVLVIGGGSAGRDVARFTSQIAEKVFFSFRKTKLFDRSSMDQSIDKPGIDCLKENSVVFVDGTQEEIDEIVYCTGYNTVFPFLSKNCQISVEENWVKPLYKHTINIERPTMAIIGLAFGVCPFPLIGIQIRFFLAHLKGHFQITKEEMYDDLWKDRKERDEKNEPKNLAHYLGPGQLEYCEDLAEVANISRLPPVLGLLFKWLVANDMPRNNYYRIVNDHEYQVIPME